jgi:hypothetical protein
MRAQRCAGGLEHGPGVVPDASDEASLLRPAEGLVSAAWGSPLDRLERCGLGHRAEAAEPFDEQAAEHISPEHRFPRIGTCACNYTHQKFRGTDYLRPGNGLIGQCPMLEARV